MYCRYCGKQISNDSIFCCYCGRQLETTKKETTYNSSKNLDDAYEIVKDGKKYTVHNGIMYDEDGWDVGRVPNGYTPEWGDHL